MNYKPITAARVVRRAKWIAALRAIAKDVGPRSPLTPPRPWCQPETRATKRRRRIATRSRRINRRKGDR